MSVLDSVLSKVGLQRKPSTAVMKRPARVPARRYAAAASNRLLYDWTPNIQTGDNAIRVDLRNMRARSRQLEQDNNYWRRWLSTLDNNVLGSEGVALQMKIRFKSGRYDKSANDEIEGAWREWGKPQYCSLSETMGWCDLQSLAIRSAARDGGILTRIIRGSPDEVNPFGFTLEPIEIDLLDDQYNDVFPNGNMVRMGVETDARKRVVAYWLLDVHPGEYLFPIRATRSRVRVDAREYLHYFVKERVTQSIGMVWAPAAMRSLHHAEEYGNAELTAARAGAAKGGWFQSEKGDTFSGESESIEDADGNVTTNTLNDFEPGSFDELPAGMTFQEYNPTHPTDAFAPFLKFILMEISAGMDADYATITGDLSNANYSSMRSGKLETWETWKKIQGHFIRHFCTPIFEKWLEMAMLVGKVNLPMSRFGAFNKPRFRGRRWPWVDPSVDVKANLDAADGGLRTRTEIIAENGGDFEDTVEELAYEQQVLKEKGITLATPARPDKPTPATTSTASSPPAEEEEEEPDEEAEENA